MKDEQSHPFVQHAGASKTKTYQPTPERILRYTCVFEDCFFFERPLHRFDGTIYVLRAINTYHGWFFNFSILNTDDGAGFYTTQS